MFDPLYATDGETFRVVRQMTEGLVAFKPGTADVEPALAKSWEQSADGLTWTFKLQDGVKFHDGTPFDAAAVCYNLDRMYNQTGAGTTQAQYWSDNMGGFKGQVDKTGHAVPSVYDSCAADGRRCRHQADPVHLEVPVDPRPAVVLHPVADRVEAVRREQRGRRG